MFLMSNACLRIWCVYHTPPHLRPRLPSMAVRIVCTSLTSNACLRICVIVVRIETLFLVLFLFLVISLFVVVYCDYSLLLHIYIHAFASI